MRKPVILPEKDSKRLYWYIVNRKEVRDLLTEWGYKKVLFLDRDYPTREDLLQVEEKGIDAAVIFLYQDSYEKFAEAHEVVYGEGRIFRLYSNFTEYVDFGDYYGIKEEDIEDGMLPIKNIEDYLDFVAWALPRADETMDEWGCVLHENYSEHCGNCHARLKKDAKYCPVCGTKRGEGKYEPFRKTGAGDVLYGCPMVIRWNCPKCGNIWDEWGFREEKYCPVCGNKGTIQKSINSFDGKSDLHGNPIEL